MFFLKYDISLKRKNDNESEISGMDALPVYFFCTFVTEGHFFI